MALSIGFLLIACSKEKADDETGVEVVVAPTLTVSSSVLTIAYEGGSYSFTCDVSDPAPDGKFSCFKGVSWISDISISSTGMVELTVAENLTSEPRTGEISIYYTYSGGSLSEKVRLDQDFAPTPELTVQPTDISVIADGGTYSFSYTIVNSVPGGEISCSADVGWISSFDCSSDGIVSFIVEENEVEEFRCGEITVTYSYFREPISEVVTVVQDPFVYEITIENMIGTYEASGAAYYSAGVAQETTWILTIYPDEDDDASLIIDGMVPTYAGTYTPDSESSIAKAYIAKAYLNNDDQLVVPSQFTGFAVQIYGVQYPLGYVPCVDYTYGVGFTYDKEGSDCTFTYSKGEWTSDYGMFIAIFRTYGDFSSFYSFYDVVTPCITLKKISSDTASQSAVNVVRPLDGDMPRHTDFICE
ncbi:MAG: hypothetical protein LUD72_03475 [Bacteroidales bacterium]|nr:hypothetical protein [Bacteroidales bacterium]